MGAVSSGGHALRARHAYGAGAVDAGGSMGEHLDWLERAAGGRAARDLVDGTLARLHHQLLRLQSPNGQAELGAIATTLRDCGAQIGDGNLARDATRLLDAAHRGRRRVRPLVRRLADEVRRTSSWLRMWLALSTPATNRPGMAAMSGLEVAGLR